MKETMYVIATRGKQGKEIYLAVDETRQSMKKIYCKWTENIDEAIATFTITDCEEIGKRYFKNFTKWYIRDYMANFK